MPEPSVSSIAIYQLRVVLCGVSPLVWRRLLVVSTTSIAELHEILQNAFGWSGERLHRFLIHGAAYGIPCLGGIVFREDARRVPLSRFRLRCGERFRYGYDFMADWKLEIRLEQTLPFDPQPRSSILYRLPISATSWQVDWQETTRDRDGGLAGKPVHMRAVLETYILPPNTNAREIDIQRNPLGIFVHDYNWQEVP